jgi:hypothetical protein
MRADAQAWAMPDDLRAHPSEVAIAREPMREVV